MRPARRRDKASVRAVGVRGRTEEWSRRVRRIRESPTQRRKRGVAQHLPALGKGV